MRRRITDCSSSSLGRIVAVVVLIVFLASVAPTARAQQIWDPAQVGTGSDGSGTWDTAANLWSNGASDSVWVNGNTAIFGSGGTAGDITVSPGIIAGGMTFNNGVLGNYTIAGSNLSLGAASTPISVASGAVATVNSVLTGLNLGIVVSGGGTLTLGANNTYTGGTTLDGGALAYTTDNLNVKALTFGATNQSANISTLDLGSANNLVGANLTATSFLMQTNNVAANSNTISIGAGKTLTINGALTIGVTTLATDSGKETSAVFSGDGSFVVNAGANNIVLGVSRANESPSTTDPKVTVNLSGLSNFASTTTGEFRLGYGGNVSGTLSLANTSNSITAATIQIGNSNNANNGGLTTLNLGAGTGTNANVIKANTINIGGGKQAGVIQFITGAPADAQVTITGQSGGASTANITVGSASSATYGGGTARLSLAGHSASVQAGAVVVGRLANATGGTSASNDIGQLTFDTGTFTANSLQIVQDSGGAAPNGIRASVTVGTDSSSTGTFTVNNTFNLGNVTSAAAAHTDTATFTVNGGTANINTDIVAINTSGSIILNSALTLNGGTLDLAGHNIGSYATPITTINLNSGNLNNVGSIAGQSIAVQIGTTIGSGTTFVLGNGGSLTSSLTPLTLGSGGGLSGGGVSQATINGDVEAASGARVSPGSSAVASTLQFNNNLAFDGGSTVRFKLSENFGSGNDAIIVGQNLTLTGTVNLEIGSVGAGPLFGNTYTLFTYGGILTGDQTNFNVIAPVGTRSNYNLLPTASTGSTVQLQVSGTAPFSLTWIGNVNNSWELMGAANWIDLSHGPGGQQFFNQDSVTFDDASTNLNDVQLVGTLSPSSITVNATRNYKFAGAGSIAGGTLTKSGTGSLIIANDNTYSGNTDIQGGTLQIGDGGTTGSIGAGTISTAATLSFKRGDATTISNAISGSGVVQQDGTGTMTLTGNSTFSGGLAVNSGAVRLTSLTGAGTGAITVNPGATLVYGAVATNPLTLAGGTVGAASALNLFTADITAAASTNSTIYLADPQNLPTTPGTDVTEFNVTGTLHGSGNFTVLSNGQDAGPDAGNAFRLRGTTASDFTGRITLGNTVKGEVQVTDAAPTSPAGTGTLVLTAGVVIPGTLTGTFSELNVRNNLTSGNATFGNNVEVSGPGVAAITPLSTTSPETSTLGNLLIGTGQTLAVGKNSAGVNTIAFQSVTINGTATFCAATHRHELFWQRQLDFGFDQRAHGRIKHCHGGPKHVVRQRRQHIHRSDDRQLWDATACSSGRFAKWLETGSGRRRLQHGRKQRNRQFADCVGPLGHRFGQWRKRSPFRR